MSSPFLDRISPFLHSILPQNKDHVSLAFATLVAGSVTSLAVWCYQDYQAFLALGPGGPPYSVKGWAWITFGIRPFALSKSGVTLVSDYPEHGAHATILELPRRQGERAQLGGIAPHRQLSQFAPDHMGAYITNLFTNAAKQHPDILETRRSMYERHHDALFVTQSRLQAKSSIAPSTAIISRGEIGHVHPDLSVHLYLSPADARQVIEKCWAERHRLSVPKTSFIKNKYAIADTYLMIYGPRNEEELEVLRIILENSIRYMTGTEDIQPLKWRQAL